MWHQEETYAKEDEDQDDIVVPMASEGTDIGRTCHLVEHQNGVVCHEEDHGVFADIPQHRDAWDIQAEQDARESAESQGDVGDDDIVIARPEVIDHRVVATIGAIQIDEHCHDDARHAKGNVLAHLLDGKVPHTSQVEEVDTDEHIVEAKPAGVVLREEPIADERQEEDEPVNLEVALPAEDGDAEEWWYFRDEVRHHIGHEEGEEEPARDIAIELARFPDVAEFHLFREGIIRIEDEPDEEEIDDVADGAPHDVGSQQALRLVFQIFLGVARYSLVEVTRLEEEERHEEVGPLHDGCPPLRTAKATGIGDVEHHHADDTDAAQQVEGMVTLFHYFLFSSSTNRSLLPLTTLRVNIRPLVTSVT